MRIKALAKAAKEDEFFWLLDEEDEEGEIVRQYVMLPGRAIFPLDGMPIVNEETLLTVMDVPMDKRDEYNVSRIRITNDLKQMVEDARETDVVVERGLMTVGMGGRTMIPIISGEKAFLLVMTC